jgi:hypothetical protein
MESEPNLDPLFRGADPGIRIRTKMSRIPKTASAAYKIKKVFIFSHNYLLISQRKV